MTRIKTLPCFSPKGILLSLLFLFAFILHTSAQERCGTVQYTQKLRNQNLLKENDAQFEQWLRQRITAKKQSQSTERTETGPYKVPIVVHVIHSNEAIGTGTNISDAQILSQIDVLNKDFKRLNADATNTPAEFANAAGSMDIQFVLAKQDPEGLATNGIVRVAGTKSSWTSNDNYQLKALSYWPAEDYFNIWVCNLTDYLGYTQFPVSNLPGLENSSQNRLTDGIVIGHLYFGTKDAGAFNLEARYDKGRTLTHETGHFFGLRHIWGDAENCTGDDYVADTPKQASNTRGCPTNPAPNGCTPSADKMFQNYLDYTDDPCMNLFTKNQVERMGSVIESSPRRASLLTSHGLLDPAPVANDLGIKQIITPHSTECDLAISPAIEIKNYGTNKITSAKIQLKVNSVIVETLTQALNLNPLESTIFNFSPFAGTYGSSTFSFTILLTNTVADGSALDNALTITTFFTQPISAPFTEPFNTLPNNWVVQNPDKIKTWELKTAPLNNNASNQAMFIDYYDYPDHQGELDILVSPSFDLTSITNAFLTFDVAYASFQGNSDGLKVVVLTNCNPDITSGTEVYNKSGSTLATAPSTDLYFTPKGTNEWRREFINLSAFIGQGKVQLAFIGINGYGNNLYLDNVSLITTLYQDLALKKVTNPIAATCATTAPKVIVQNMGTKLVNSFDVQYKVNGGTLQTSTFSSLALQPGYEAEVTLPAVTLTAGLNTISFTAANPNNGETDINPNNDTKVINVITSVVTDQIPLRENFDTDFSKTWLFVNPSGSVNWAIKNTTNSDGATVSPSVYFNAFNDTSIGDEAWLLSPLLDLTRDTAASVFFDFSYASRAADANDKLSVYASVGCEDNFSIKLFPQDNTAQNIKTSSGPWAPTNAADWSRKFIDLTSLAGKKDIRLGFVATNGNDNNMYIDNIEFFTSNNPNPPIIDNPNKNSYVILPSQNSMTNYLLTFDLTEEHVISMQVIDTMGRLIVQNTYYGVLNQTYPINLENNASGMYIVRLHDGQNYSTSKIFIQR